MKYLKLLEDYNVPFKELPNKNDNIEFLFTIDKDNFKVVFIETKNNVYERSYKRINAPGHSYSTVNGNPYKIIETVTNITKDFIKNYDPNAIVISQLEKI